MKNNRLSPRRDVGIALITVLAMLVLITAAVLAFYTHATSNLVVESSYTQRTKAVLLNRSAGDYVTSLFIQEITAPTRSVVTATNGATYYIPKSGTCAAAQRLVTASLLTDTNAFNLVRQSIPSADSNASSDNSATPARNGRVISLDRWNLPKLLVGSGFTQSSQLPQWVYINGTSGITSSASSGVMGRFAYNVYRVDGLLNVNAAGYSSQAGLNTAQIAALKATQAGVDLTLLGLGSTTVDNLAAFRNPGTYSSPSGSVAAAATNARNGFTASYATNADGSALSQHFFAGRQDLIQYTISKDPTLAAALPYLTHFSCSVNAPCAVSSDTNTTINPPLAGVCYSGSATITHYNDTGAPEYYEVTGGSPLLQRRFSLAKLAWLTCKGPSAKLPTTDLYYNAGGSEAAIRACFGLTWDTANARWIYTGTSTTIVQQSINTLSTVAAQGREPNFFELLKAGIAEGSLGQSAWASTPLSGGGSPSVQPTLDSSKDLHILKIGANIIDCADSDNYPTIIYFAPGGLGVETAGVEDLPYLFGVGSSFLTNCTGTVAVSGTWTFTGADVVWTPSFFNPHSTLSGSATSGPTSVTAEMLRGTVTSMGFLGKSYNVTNGNITHSNLGGQSFAVSSSSFRSGPGVVTGSTGAAQSLLTLVPYATGNTDVLCFRIFSFSNSLSSADSANPITYSGSKPYLARGTLTNVGISLHYTSPVGPEKNYSTLGSYDDGAGGINMGTVYADSNTGSPNAKTLASAYTSILWDPRTGRLGPSQTYGPSWATGTTPNPATDVVRNRDPFNWGANAANLHWGQWPQGGKTGGYANCPVADYHNAQDPDTVTRPADGWLGDNANPYRDLTDHQRRPVILQRPYKTVAELGYVFRDCPWKTLSFFDETSGDAALLDLFSVVDEPAVTAGRINPATAPQPVLQSLLCGIAQSADGTDPLTSASAVTLSSAYAQYVSTGLQPAASFPMSIADLPKFLSSSSGTSALPGMIKYRNEALPRALANSAQTRTWNFLIDCIAQSGRFKTGTTAGDFRVEGESRCWLSVAIDRYTGEVVSRQWEWVGE